MIKNAPPKHPQSSKWYWLQWSATELQNATISTSTWTVPAGITKDQISVVGLLVGIRLSGGTLDQDYELENKITTSNGETLHETLIVRIKRSGH